MSNFSIKKPYTIFVGVIIVIILGVISFMNLTTDLLPSMELPYVAIITTYVGASSEKVEEAVSKPIEQAMMTISNVQDVRSTSSENYSMVFLEFSGDSNMDSVMIEISQELNMIESSLEDGVSTPTVMQINPDMLPILMTAVDSDDMDITELTEFANENLVTELESVNGVASVDLYGAVEDEIKITLDQEKIDAVNDKVLASVSSELAKTKRELDSSKAKINSGKAELEATKAEKGKEIADGISAVESGREEITKAEIELKTKGEELTKQKAQLEGNLAEVTAAEKELTTQKQALEAQKATLDTQIAELQTQKSVLEARKAELAEKQATGEITAEEDIELTDAINSIIMLDASIEAIQSNEGYTQLVSGLEVLNEKYAEVVAGKKQLTSGISQISAGLSQMNTAQEQINHKKKEIDEMSSTLQIAQSTLVSETTKAETQLDIAKQQLDSGMEQFESARDEAYKNASIDGIITMDLISNILTAENFSMPAGYVNDDIIIKVGEKFQSIDEIKNLVLFSFDIKGLEEVTLEDVSNVEVTNNEDEIYTKINNNAGLILSFSKQSMASTKDVSEAVQDKLEELSEKYDNISFTNLMDQGVYIDMIIGSVLQSLAFGGILAIVILYIFLKELKPTIIVAVSIPISLVFAVSMMYFTGISINIMSLSGLALGVGMLVDNSIVVIENIYRLKKEGKDIKDAAREGAEKIGGAIIASTLTTICVFLPIVFVQGLSRQLFADIGLTIAYSLIASLIVALTVVPAFASKLLIKVNNKENKSISKLTKKYVKLLEMGLKHKAIVIILVVVLLGVSAFLTTIMDLEFIPDVSSDQMSISFTLPKDSSEDEKDISNQIINRLLEIEDIDKVGAYSSSGSDSLLSASEGISMYIILDEARTHTNVEVASLIKEKTKDLNCDIEISTSTMDMSSMMASGVSIRITGNDIQTLYDIAKDAQEKLSNIDGIGEIEGIDENSQTEKLIKVDKNEAMKYGLTIAQVYQVVAGELKEQQEGIIIEIENKNYQIIVNKPQSEQVSLDNIMSLELEAKENNEDVTIKLSDIASLEDETGLNTIHRENNVRYITIDATINDDASTTQVSREVEKVFKDYETPNGYQLSIEGEIDSIMEYMYDLILMIIVAVMFIYLIMVSQFQSFKLPFIVMFTIPLAFTGGLFALFFTGQSLSIIAMLGFLVLAGVVVNNGIVFIDSINQLREEGMERKEAILKTGSLRLRPILMTAMTTILGMLVMALGIGDGSEMTKPLGIVTIGGLMYSTLLTLFLCPVLYDILCKKELKH